MFEIIVLIATWIVVGIWIAYKRKWYNGESFLVFWAVVFAPINLIVVFSEVFILKPWVNNKEEKIWKITKEATNLSDLKIDIHKILKNETQKKFN